MTAQSDFLEIMRVYAKRADDASRKRRKKDGDTAAAEP